MRGWGEVFAWIVVAALVSMCFPVGILFLFFFAGCGIIK